MPALTVLLGIDWNRSGAKVEIMILRPDKSGKRMSRRQMVAGFSAACGMALLPWSGTQTKEAVHKRLDDALHSIFEDLRAAQAVGRMYLAGHSVPPLRLHRLTRMLIIEAREGPDAVRQKVLWARDHDWHSGSVVIVGGYVLARTEADLCALALGA